MKRMKYSEAINLLVEFLKKEHPDFSKHPEFMAIVTHFLQNPQICPPFMSKEIYKESRNLLASSENCEKITQDTATTWTQNVLVSNSY